MRVLWPLKWQNTLQKQPPKGPLQICFWQLLLKAFKSACEGVKFPKKVEMNAFLATFQQLTVMLRNNFSLTLSARGYFCLIMPRGWWGAHSVSSCVYHVKKMLLTWNLAESYFVMLQKKWYKKNFKIAAIGMMTSLIKSISLKNYAKNG